MLSVVIKYFMLNVIMQSVIMLSVIMLSVIMLSVIMLSVIMAINHRSIGKFKASIDKRILFKNTTKLQKFEKNNF